MQSSHSTAATATTTTTTTTNDEMGYSQRDNTVTGDCRALKKPLRETAPQQQSPPPMMQVKPTSTHATSDARHPVTHATPSSPSLPRHLERMMGAHRSKPRHSQRRRSSSYENNNGSPGTTSTPSTPADTPVDTPTNTPTNTPCLTPTMTPAITPTNGKIIDIVNNAPTAKLQKPQTAPAFGGKHAPQLTSKQIHDQLDDIIGDLENEIVGIDRSIERYHSS